MRRGGSRGGDDGKAAGMLNREGRGGEKWEEKKERREWVKNKERKEKERGRREEGGGMLKDIKMGWRKRKKRRRKRKKREGGNKIIIIIRWKKDRERGKREGGLGLWWAVVRGCSARWTCAQVPGQRPVGLIASGRDRVRRAGSHTGRMWAGGAEGLGLDTRTTRDTATGDAPTGQSTGLVPA